MSEENQLIFDPAQINRIHNPLIRVLRLLYTKLGMTEQKFRDLHHRYFTMFDSTADTYTVSGNRSNEKKLIQNDKRLSWNKFIRGTVDIPDLELMESRYRFRDPRTGEEFWISSLDRIDRDGEYAPYVAPEKKPERP